MQCTMLVVDENGYQWFQEHQIPMSTDLPNITHVSSTRPRDASTSDTPSRSTENGERTSRNGSHSHNGEAAIDAVEAQEERKMVFERYSQHRIQ